VRLPGKRAKKKFVPIVEEAPPPSPAIHGRSASWNPANRFEKLHVDLGDADVVQIDPTSEEEEKPRRETQFFRDLTRTIIARKLMCLNENWWHPGNDLSQICLYFEEKPDGFLHWFGGAYAPINTALFNCIACYAVSRDIPIVGEP